MYKAVARLLPLLFLFCHFNTANAQQHAPDLKLGDVVVSGFSGTVAAEPRGAKPSIDRTFINPDGPSARIFDVSKPGHVWDGSLLPAPTTFDVLAKDVGQVFGVALDDADPPNIYLGATSIYGLNIVARGRDGQLERRKKGGPGVVWMKGQFGLDLQGGPGAIYKVDGRTGVVTLFANVTLNDVPNPGPGLGNLAYDAGHKQLFVSDLYTGMIHRFALDGRELGQPFDHGVTGGPTHGNVPAQPFNPRARLNIATPRFNAEDPDTWDYAPPARRVWALAVHEDRLYYSARNGAPQNGPQIWSVGIAQDGGFAADPRWELDVPGEPGPYAVSDIAFSQAGAMILAQRGKIAASYDYSAFTFAGEPRVLRYWLKDKNDPPSPGRWKPVPEEYAVGFAGSDRNSNGGVALGYGYDRNGMMNEGSCEAALWTTGQNLRNNPALRSQLEPGGPLVVHGLQGSPADQVRNANTPPATSYFVDYDGKFNDARNNGHIGSVRAYVKPCAPIAIAQPVAPPPPMVTPIGCLGPNCGNACKPTCICPPGTELKGRECVKTDVCPPPMVPGPIPGQCICPPGTVLDGKICVPASKIQVQTCTPPMIQSQGGPCICPPPMVPGATPNSCVCPQGSVLVDGQCVPQTTTCTPPLVLDPVTKTCVCPQGTVRQGRQCVPQACPATMVPGPCECPEGTKNEDGICVPIKKVDLGIKKTGATSPACPVRDYIFTITVTNVGPTWPANGNVVVHDTVPPGMTFTVPPPCLPSGVLPQGTPFTCTYNGPPPGPNQPLPTINILATANGPAPFPPFTNCASVTIPSISNYVDSNPANNNSCVTVTKPKSCNEGTLSVTKKVAPDPRGIGNTLSFPMTVTCTNQNTSYTLSVNGNTSSVPHNVPVGSHCTVAETLPALPKGCTWLPPIFTPPGVTIANGLNQEMVTNGYRCDGEYGSLVVKKIAESHSPIALPPMTFPVTVTCGGTVTNLNLSSDGTPQTVNNIPLNTNCTVQEGSFTTPPNACPPNMNPAWTTTYSPPSPVPVTGPNTQETIHNILDCERGGSVAATKRIDNRTKADLTGMTFPAIVTCGGNPHNLTLSVPGPQVLNNIPVGTVCSITETPPPAPANGCPPGFVPTWMAPQYSPASTTVVAGSGAALDVLNILYCKQVIEPPKPACDPRSTIPRDNTCSCRYEGMEHTSPTMCMCKEGKLEPGKGCVTPNACPPPKVPGPTPGSCICGPGYKARGDGCVKVLVCGEHSTLNRAGTGCMCKTGFIKKGDMCIPKKQEKREKKRNEPGIKRDDVIRGLELIPGIGGGSRDGGSKGGGSRNGGSSGGTTPRKP